MRPASALRNVPDRTRWWSDRTVHRFCSCRRLASSRRQHRLHYVLADTRVLKINKRLRGNVKITVLGLNRFYDERRMESLFGHANDILVGKRLACLSENRARH